jgi:hypothetical protein
MSPTCWNTFIALCFFEGFVLRLRPLPGCMGAAAFRVGRVALKLWRRCWLSALIARRNARVPQGSPDGFTLQRYSFSPDKMHNRCRKKRKKQRK